MEISLVPIGRLPDETLIEDIKKQMQKSLNDVENLQITKKQQKQKNKSKIIPFTFNFPFHNTKTALNLKSDYSIETDEKTEFNFKIHNKIKPIKKPNPKSFEINIKTGEPIKLNPLSYDEKKGGRLTETLYNDLWQRLSKTDTDLIAGFIDAKLLNKTFEFYENMYARYEDHKNGKGGAIISIKELYEKEKRIKSVKRITKALLHEIGHGFGLGHCKPPCVMADAKSMEKLDQNEIYYCKECQKSIKQNIKKETKNKETEENKNKDKNKKWNISFSTLGLSNSLKKR